MEDDVFVEKVCTQLAELIRNSPHYKSNRDFALNAGIDEKTLRLILQGKYNMSLKILNRICDCLGVSVCEVIDP
jgi:DNA-binding Xre family transcriptional regulator